MIGLETIWTHRTSILDVLTVILTLKLSCKRVLVKYVIKASCL